MAGRSREREHPRALSGIPSYGMPPHPTDEARLKKPVTKRAIHGNQRERGHYRRAFFPVRQGRVVAVSQIGKRQVRNAKTFRYILGNLFLELVGQTEKHRRLRNISVLRPASPGIVSRALSRPPLPPRRIYRPSVYRPLISRYCRIVPVIVVGAHAYDLSRWAHRRRLRMLVTTISRRIQGERRAVMTFHHRQWMTRTGNAGAPKMKPHIALV